MEARLGHTCSVVHWTKQFVRRLGPIVHSVNDALLIQMIKDSLPTDLTVWSDGPRNKYDPVFRNKEQISEKNYVPRLARRKVLLVN